MDLDDLKEAIDQYQAPDMRDRFAIAALTGILSARGYSDAKAVAAEAYAIADAMVAEMGDGRAASAQRDEGPVT
jgi:hypothetical protein